jgi:hypothetical protein
MSQNCNSSVRGNAGPAPRGSSRKGKAHGRRVVPVSQVFLNELIPGIEDFGFSAEVDDRRWVVDNVQQLGVLPSCPRLSTLPLIERSALRRASEIGKSPKISTYLVPKNQRPQPVDNNQPVEVAPQEEQEQQAAPQDEVQDIIVQIFPCPEAVYEVIYGPYPVKVGVGSGRYIRNQILIDEEKASVASAEVRNLENFLLTRVRSAPNSSSAPSKLNGKPKCNSKSHLDLNYLITYGAAYLAWLFMLILASRVFVEMVHIVVDTMDPASIEFYLRPIGCLVILWLSVSCRGLLFNLCPKVDPDRIYWRWNILPYTSCNCRTCVYDLHCSKVDVNPRLFGYLAHCAIGSKRTNDLMRDLRSRSDTWYHRESPTTDERSKYIESIATLESVMNLAELEVNMYTYLKSFRDMFVTHSELTKTSLVST